MPDTSDPDSPLGDPAVRLAVAVGRINRRIRPTGDGLSHGLMSALSTIVRQGPIRPSELARIEAVAAPTATRAVADLEARGLIERTPDPEDGRSSLLTATQDGVTAVMHARMERAERVARLLESLTDDQRSRVWDALDALEAAAGIRH
ncbi:MarR family winged helix-turn-helix transcriptional regulator [Microbacterium mangrovi]|uniref:MarR family winged helix-turn-helix transcriptional regulator n=1 Tax=Microbacterium mangrovi TaxID=1348253 RepID=UPI00068A6C5F|nr:MarR family transcriptional regulator [Microbacterium mangrovi]